jgi:prepilin-type N-terminal cleavage/methylation domain-containing protein
MPNYSPNSNQDQALRTCALRRVVGFTLIELLVVMAIISLLSAALLVALTELQASTKKGRCQQQIKKIDQLIIRRWDEILHKSLPIQLSPSGSISIPQQILRARRELLRLEMPERITDIFDAPIYCPVPGTTKAFRRKANSSAGWTEEHQGAECLYLILSVMQDRDASALDFFFPGEIGDTDEDGMPEILDGFNQPIGFLRWAPGISYRGPPIHNPRHQSRYSDIQDINPVDSPDATDMGAADSRLGGNNTADDPFNLFPLIMSAGRDGEFGLELGITSPFSYKQHFNDPFHSTHGTPIDDTILDNISNHQIEVNP